ILIGTNPRDKDTDNDGLTDGDEYIAYETSPLVKDTDGDGYNDRTEVATKNNPLGPGRATADQLDRWSRLKYRPAPTIKNLQVAVSGTLATVSWTTDIDADGIVNWGPTAAYGKYRSNFAFRKSQSISFTVTPGVEYHYAVRACSTAPSPRCTTSADAVFNVPAATSGPVISDVVVDQTYGYATVRWTVDPAADGIVNYGLTDAYGAYKNSTTFKGSHSISFAVTPGKTYHYAIRSCTVGAVCTTTPDATFTSTTNAVGPTLGPITVGFSGSVATVSWATDIAADGIVNYGPTDAYGTYVSSFPFATSHAIQFTVAPATTYHYAVRSCTQGGLCTTSADATFTTP
ncbi:MAG: hypothetical protein HY976_03435, partial [Candidatus Kerfeldbacteria bacterium]|nr:hypothetical protein [Candidatus Kerfeldbacteria bacterium]